MIPSASVHFPGAASCSVASLGIDLLWCDFLAQSLTSVPPLASTILAETDPQIEYEINKHHILGSGLFTGLWWFPSLSRI